LKVIFYGSLDSSRPDHGEIETNFKALVKLMARDRVEFVLRSVNPAVGPGITPIDNIVLAALREHNSTGKKVDVTILHEPNDPQAISWGLPVKTYTASTKNRVQFYSELMKLEDIVIGVGGQLGLIRLAISCEWTRHPFFVLPGSGGSTELLWSEMFAKSFQVRNFPETVIEELRQMPYINCADKDYAARAYKVVRIFFDNALRYGNRSADPKTEAIGLADITLGSLIHEMRRLSVDAWLGILSLLASLVSAAYFLGTQNIIAKLLALGAHK
jgi:hypothetical protein